MNSLNHNANIAYESETRSGGGVKGKEMSTWDVGGDDWNSKFVPYDDEASSIDHSKVLTVNSSLVDDEKVNGKQWGKDRWWKQDDGNGELCSKDCVMEWIGSQICPSKPDWDDGKNNIHEKTDLENSSPIDKHNDANGPQLEVLGIGNTDDGVEKKESRGKKNGKKKLRYMQEWRKEEHLAELSKKRSKLKHLQTKWKKGLKVLPHFDLGGEDFMFAGKKTLLRRARMSVMLGNSVLEEVGKRKILVPLEVTCGMVIFSAMSSAA